MRGTGCGERWIRTWEGLAGRKGRGKYYNNYILTKIKIAKINFLHSGGAVDSGVLMISNE